MTTSKELVQGFQALHINKYGIAISYETAQHQLNELAELLRLTFKVEAKR